MVLKDLDLLGPCSQQTLADIEQVRKPTMTVLMQQMEKRGWIRRGVNPDNARFKLVTITPKGAEKLRTEGSYLKKCLNDKLKGLPESVFRDLENALGPIATMWMGQTSEDKY
jgi:DNA-binding MarR family transcriptional regulator